jgi:hypothetical protein
MTRCQSISLLLAILAWTTAPAVCAHTLSESFSSWQISGPHAELEYTVPDLEAKRLSSSGKDFPSDSQLVQYLSRHIGVTSGSKPCRPDNPGHLLAAQAGFYRVEFSFKCVGGDVTTIHSSAFLDLVPSHTNFARIQVSDGTVFEQLITKDNQSVETSATGTEGGLQNAGFLRFIEMGIMHIFTGIDHMSFMLGLVLISRRLRDLLFVITGFTVGHSLTLGLAVTGILRPNGQYIDALVALTIALIGAENIADSTRRPLPLALGLGGLLVLFGAARGLGVAAITLPPLLLLGGGVFAGSYLMMSGQLRDASRIRILVTLVFGLIHGFGFASNLLEMSLPANRIAELLLGFNLGVEVGQVAVVLTALLLAQLLVRLRLTMPRPLFGDLAAAFLVGEGLFWFVTRSMVLG